MLKLSAIVTIGKDAVVSQVGNNTVINFSGAHSERFKDSSGNQQEKTTWVDFAKWGEKTGIAQYLTKGSRVYVEGTPEIKTFNRNDGSMGASFTVRVSHIELLGGNREQGGQQQQQSTTPPPVSAPQADTYDDDLPF